MDRPLLSVCIPTFNRAHYLKDCLESLAIQVRHDETLNNIIEVIVSDNASTDDTRKTAESYKNTFTHFTYRRSKENVGFDYNTIAVVKAASGTYAWYLGDDDVIVNGALAYVTSILATHQYDIGGVHAKPQTSPTEHTHKQTFGETDVITVQDPNDYYFKGYCQGGVSVLIFNRAMWLNEVDETHFIEHWLYYETVLKILIKSQKKSFFVTKVAVITGQDCRWAENGNELFTYTNSNILLKHMLDWGFEKKRIQTVLDENKKKLPLMILRAKGHGLPYNPSNLIYMWRHMTHAGPLRLFVVTILFCIPNPLVRFVRDKRKT